MKDRLQITGYRWQGTGDRVAGSQRCRRVASLVIGRLVTHHASLITGHSLVITLRHTLTFHVSRFTSYAFLLLLLFVFSAAPAAAQTGGDYDLTWWTIDNGGDEVRGGEYALLGTAGQPDAQDAISGGAYALDGGFWSGSLLDRQGPVYLPVILRGAFGLSTALGSPVETGVHLPVLQKTQ